MADFSAQWTLAARREVRHPSARLLMPVYAVSRLVRLAVITFMYAPAFLARNLVGPRTGPVLLRRYFERCGGAYVKFGQLLATRYDLVRPAYTEELEVLFDDLRPVPTPTIVEAFERSLGVRWDSVFSSFEEAPIAGRFARRDSRRMSGKQEAQRTECAERRKTEKTSEKPTKQVAIHGIPPKQRRRRRSGRRRRS